MIPLNQLIPECLLALGAAFLLGNLAAYIRLRPAWREAKRRGRGGGQAASPEAKQRGRGARAATREARVGTPAKGSRTARDERTPVDAEPGGQRRAQGATSGKPGAGTRPKANGERRTTGAKATERTRAGTSGRVHARVGEPTRSGAALPPRARVLANVVIGLVISLAALATLLRG